MSLKKFLLLLILSVTQGYAWGQDSTCIEKEYSIISKIIRRAIPYTDAGGDYNADEKVAEYFVMEIMLNEKRDSITTINYYSKDGAKNKRQIEKAITKIKEKWKPNNCGVNRIIIPLFLYFQNDSEKLENYPFNLTGETFVSNEPGQLTYMAKGFAIFVFGKVR